MLIILKSVQKSRFINLKYDCISEFYFAYITSTKEFLPSTFFNFFCEILAVSKRMLVIYNVGSAYKIDSWFKNLFIIEIISFNKCCSRKKRIIEDICYKRYVLRIFPLGRGDKAADHRLPSREYRNLSFRYSRVLLYMFYFVLINLSLTTKI